MLLYTHLLLSLQASVLWLFIVTFNHDAKPPPKWILREFNVSRIQRDVASRYLWKRHGFKSRWSTDFFFFFFKASYANCINCVHSCENHPIILHLTSSSLSIGAFFCICCVMERLFFIFHPICWQLSLFELWKFSWHSSFNPLSPKSDKLQFSP